MPSKKKRPLEVPSGQSREETRQTELIDPPRALICPAHRLNSSGRGRVAQLHCSLASTAHLTVREPALSESGRDDRTCPNLTTSEVGGPVARHVAWSSRP